MELPAARRARVGERLVLIALVAGVDVDRDERKLHRRALAQDVENLQQRPAVLAAGQSDHDAVAVFNQVEVDDRLGGLLREAGLERCAVCHVGSVSYATVYSGRVDGHGLPAPAYGRQTLEQDLLHRGGPRHRAASAAPASPRRIGGRAIVHHLPHRAGQRFGLRLGRRIRWRRRARARTGRRCRGR